MNTYFSQQQHSNSDSQSQSTTTPILSASATTASSVELESIISINDGNSLKSTMSVNEHEHEQVINNNLNSNDASCDIALTANGSASSSSLSTVQSVTNTEIDTMAITVYNKPNHNSRKLISQTQTVTYDNKSKTKTLTFQKNWFDKFAWLHCSDDIHGIRGVICFYCNKAHSSQALTGVHVEPQFVFEGFTNWKKALEKFEQHELTQCHSISIKHWNQQNEIPILNLLITTKEAQQKKSKSILFKIITSLRYLARQGLAIRGHDSSDGNFMQLLKLRQGDCEELKNWMQRAKSYTGSTIQNEILEILAHTVLRTILNDIRKSCMFSIIVDGTQDCTKIEQEALCIRYVDDKLQPRLNHLAILNAHSDVLDNTDLNVVARDFVMKSDARLLEFGQF